MNLTRHIFSVLYSCKKQFNFDWLIIFCNINTFFFFLSKSMPLVIDLCYTKFILDTILRVIFLTQRSIEIFQIYKNVFFYRYKYEYNHFQFSEALDPILYSIFIFSIKYAFKNNFKTFNFFL
ncbi:hypothetical protein EDEG_00932 [Edhazardia aedis USNM 41457]|uniref:Transmembrane protein n=1 Tax=Edhazardia aedis (strain USNM 41457) TaxID=1003232 RepID=J9DBS2_EDHAE|nr:hypothetical protein EDEG_00932 [Edhazardia aedis USNM 41457]|eukprot:EJW04939.1 hypothetical protein EDEG_00932 [Edhazardia aedis USNM 41457]